MAASETRTGISCYVAIGAAGALKADFDDCTAWTKSFTPGAIINTAGSKTGAGDSAAVMQGRNRPEYGEITWEFMDSMATNSPYNLLKTLSDTGNRFEVRYRAESTAVATDNPEFVYVIVAVSGLMPPATNTENDGTATTQTVTLIPETVPAEETS